MAIDFSADSQDIIIEQDSTAVITLTPVNDEQGAPLDMTGWTASLDVKNQLRDVTPLFSLTPVVDNGANKITITIQPSDTASLNLSGQGLEAFYDLKLVDGANTYKPMKGSFTINKQVT